MLVRYRELLSTYLAPQHPRVIALALLLAATTVLQLWSPQLLRQFIDPTTEHLIERAVDRLLHRRTAIVIAHRLGTVQRADDILLLEYGRLLEYGERAVLATQPTHSLHRVAAVAYGGGAAVTTNDERPTTNEEPTNDHGRLTTEEPTNDQREQRKPATNQQTSHELRELTTTNEYDRFSVGRSSLVVGRWSLVVPRPEVK